MTIYAVDRAKLEASQALTEALKTQVAPGEIRYAPPEVPGDLAFPCFALAKTLKKNPALIASDLMAALFLKPGGLIAKAEAHGGYLNFFLDGKAFIGAVIGDFQDMGPAYGTHDRGKGRKVIIDFSSPNIAKPFSVGHLRTTNIGDALVRIMKAMGYETIGDNHIGDWGTQFGKLIYAYHKWGDREAIEKNPIRELLSLYVRFHEEAGILDDEHPQGEPGGESGKPNLLEDEARALFKKLEEGDREITMLWEWIREVSLSDFQKVYGMLGITFDEVLGESFYNDKMGEVKELARQKGILEEDAAGTLLVRLDSYGISTPLLIQKKDGTSLYATRDLACAIYRIRRWNPEKILYVVGEEQQLYFRQVFKVIELLGFTTPCEHVYFGLVVLPGSEKISTRKGNVVFLEEVLEEACRRAAEVIEDRPMAPEKKEAIVKAVGVGAVKYHDLSQNRKKNVTFDWDKMLSLDGNSSPYLQYSYARARSILRKASSHPSRFHEGEAVTPEERDLIHKLARFPEAVSDAAAQCFPHLVATYLFELAQLFSAFYNNVAVLTASSEPLRENRLMLVDFYSQVMKAGLGLLGIEVLEEM
ncbi:MAG: arginine--tRNA ligase [Candidatus Eremiobacteraeota bacterium]|nr:arginine--tRNA ligase [Candidatus Eremiobacteraeota bacterium]